MYQAIVFLPLLGCVLAGLIALAGARARCPGEGPPAEEEGAAAPHHGAHAGRSHATQSHDAHAPAPAAIGLSILVAYYRNRGSIAVEDINLMKG